MTPLEKLLNRSDKTEIKKLNKLVDEIDALEEKISSLNDEELKNMTNIFKERLKKRRNTRQYITRSICCSKRSIKKGIRYEAIQSTTYRGNSITSR